MLGMTLRELSYELDRILKDATRNVITVANSIKGYYRAETKIVEDYVSFINRTLAGRYLFINDQKRYKFQLSNPKRYILSIRAGVIDKNPLVKFCLKRPCSKGPCGNAKIELADILFVVKYLDYRGRIQKGKAAFVQAKLDRKTKPNIWDLDGAQLEFLSNYQKYPFYFDKQTWVLKRMRSKWLFTYLLISRNCSKNITLSPLIFMGSNCKNTVWTYQYGSRSWPYYYHSWIYMFLRERGIGPSLWTNAGCVVTPIQNQSSKYKSCKPWDKNLCDWTNCAIKSIILKDLTDALYRFAEIYPDPPEEFEDNRGEGTFGIVEFTFAPSEEAMKRYKESRETR